jgi:predicted nucleic acid-binding protein
MAQGLKLVVDSSVWIDYYRATGKPHEQLLDSALENTLVMVPNLVLLEVLRGIPSEKQVERVARDFSNFECFDIIGRDIHFAAARNFRHLRSLGKTVRSSVDLLIGTWCIENDIALLHNDRDYDVMAEFLGLPIWRGELG